MLNKSGGANSIKLLNQAIYKCLKFIFLFYFSFFGHFTWKISKLIAANVRHNNTFRFIGRKEATKYDRRQVCKNKLKVLTKGRAKESWHIKCVTILTMKFPFHIVSRLFWLVGRLNGTKHSKSIRDRLHGKRQLHSAVNDSIHSVCLLEMECESERREAASIQIEKKRFFTRHDKLIAEQWWKPMKLKPKQTSNQFCGRVLMCSIWIIIIVNDQSIEWSSRILTIFATLECSCSLLTQHNWWPHAHSHVLFLFLFWGSSLFFTFAIVGHCHQRVDQQKWKKSIENNHNFAWCTQTIHCTKLIVVVGCYWYARFAHQVKLNAFLGILHCLCRAHFSCTI